MSSDISRQRFAPKNDFAAVLMQQGRVLLDADWNEFVEILDRRRRAETVDTIGRGTVPTETPDAFRVEIDGGNLLIGPGRLYLNGLLAENHGTGPQVWNGVLAELSGEGSVRYDAQPYFPEAGALAPLPQGGGPHLVFLKVWQREVTPLQRPDLIESAVGVDSTTRWQTVWQVRVLPEVGEEVTCATPDSDLPAWHAEIAPSGGRLSTGTTEVDDEEDPCIVPPTGGYKGLENRLYRVEVHTVDAAGNATFKWARHNASIATAVRTINGTDLTVDLVGHDAELRFSTGDWVEVTDDVRELGGLPGILRQIADVTDATRTITLAEALPAGTFPTSVGGATLEGRRTRLRRWDQKGQIRTTDGTVHADLDDASLGGVIPVATDGTSLLLEDGIHVTFSLASAGTRFRPGDHWVFIARSADASIEILEAAPPRGIHAHYCRLGLVTFPGTVIDCRTFWPPSFEGEGGCGCTVCVSPESHESGVLTIQQAINQVRATGGTVCLDTGIYNLPQSFLNIEGAQSVRLIGKGWRTILTHTGPGATIHIRSSIGFTMERLTILTSRLQPGTADVAIENSMDVSLQDCYFLQAGGREVAKAAIGLSGVVLHTRIQDNVFFSAGGVAGASIESGDGEVDNTLLATLGLRIERNQMLCTDFGIRLRGFSLHLGDTVIAENFITDAQHGGIVTTGYVGAEVFHGSRLEVQGNVLRVSGDAITCGVDAARIEGNDIGQESVSRSRHGIVLSDGLAGLPLKRLQITQNRITGLEEHGILIDTDLASGLIKLNQLEDLEGFGLLMTADATAEELAIENNQFLATANMTRARSDDRPLAGAVHLVRVRDLQLIGNTVRDTGLQAENAPRLAGIQLVVVGRAHLSGNRIVNLGPVRGAVRDTVSLAVLGTHLDLIATENFLIRHESTAASGDNTLWRALQILPQPPPRENGEPGTGTSDLPTGGAVAWGAGMEYLVGNRRLGATPIAPGTCSLRGLRLDGSSPVPLVQVSSGRLTFSDNAVRLTRTVGLMAELRGQYIVFSGNHFEAAQPIDGAVAHLFVPTPDTVTHVPEPTQYTALGNILSGTLHINGQRLPQPLRAPFNREMI